MKRAIALILILAAAFCFTACSSENAEESAEFGIAATVFPAYDFARQIAGDRMPVKLIIPPGSDLHSFEPTAKDIITMENWLVVCNGGESEHWVEEVFEGNESHYEPIYMMDCVDVVEEELKEQTDRAGGLADKIAEQRQRAQDAEQGIAALQETLATLLKEAEELSGKAGSAAEEAEALRAKEALAIAESADAKADKSALAAAMKEMEERSLTIDGDVEGMEQQLAATEAEAKKCRRALEDAEEEAAAVRNIIEGHALKLKQKESRSEEAKAKAVELTMELNAMDSRIHMLSEMEKEYEGFNKAVKTVMSAAEHGTLRGVHAPVANLMETDRKFAVAMEIALGAALQNIVVDREEDGKNAIHLLKQRNAGRTTFLPLTAIRGDELREKGVEQELGYVGVASDLVRYEEKYRPIFLNLLGRTVVVEDIDCAIAMARKYQNRFRIVTLDGQVMNRGGSMTGGSISQNSGVLSRAGELKELTAKRGKLAEARSAAEKDAEEKIRDLQRTRYELETAAEQQRSAEDEVLRRQGEKNHYDVLLGAMRENLDNLTKEKETLSSRFEETKKGFDAATQRIEEAEQRAAELRRAAEKRRATAQARAIS